MTLYRWSQTASADATADPTINWSEGQAPSSINDSARAMMAAMAKYRDDIAGAIVTTGSSTAYALASYQQFDTLAHLNGQIIAFTPHVTNGATVTLNVDSLGAKPLRSGPNTELLAGTLIQGTPYIVVYNNSDGAFYLHGFYGNLYNIPIGASIEYWAGTAPNSSFAFPYGQAINRTTYAALFALIGTNYGPGDGTTTFNLPDLRGRVIACVDNMGGTSANRLASGGLAAVRHTLGGAGGEDTHMLTASEMPTHYHSASIYDPGHLHSTSHSGLNIAYQGASAIGITGSSALQISTSTAFSVQGAGTGVRVNSSNGLDTTYSAGGGTAHNVVQPTILCARIMRII
ncbi:putative phage tail Collar Domain [Bradyrhizobium sp. STM 3843]|uniref:phage tail protein n=1 Tax=Bradyrhizobium sp. STM 3843 TaxID=551947 RepID=UPI000240A820|nr:tail fiber protein [Bradyrhizobium sp. STM 3843]CCE04145.1 putative phage tail Collar Domain [Bradyrhizobium sp. STM 3843]